LFALEYVLLGAVLLNEYVSATFLFGAALVLAGIVLVSACGTLTLLFTARKKQGRVEP
jgi:drug/metabolite transporter (DMT)-like permease